MHQHPLSYSPFSNRDIMFSLNNNVPITRVVTLDGSHEIMFGNDILSDYKEKNKIKQYFINIEEEQKDSDEYKLLYKVCSGKNTLRKKRDALIKEKDFVELFKFEKKLGFHDVGKKASMEVISRTAEKFGFIYTYYPTIP